eukprot:CAMPEP_0202960894 /NCGR_PEP_ID=MMETSP1396-20130829/5042_1 /ASSEMBLY_ACC=CAM_ASM_000872 /TAXON_ID= /ORGANISM="Pseudokeronopsis sp., Strain Brazil" /LENGTH=100 /DNA_ID=CAMNT_0049680419 /DNA_START=713 /DNA_END=1015 /DNA_ORIENTATION=-
MDFMNPPGSSFWQAKQFVAFWKSPFFSFLASNVSGSPSKPSCYLYNLLIPPLNLGALMTFTAINDELFVLFKVDYEVVLFNPFGVISSLVVEVEYRFSAK